MNLAPTLERTRQSVAETRRRRKAIQRAKPKIFLYKNNPDGSPGVVFRGRINFRELTKHKFPDVKNVSSAGMLEIRADHYLAKWILTVPNDPDECKNILIRIDMYGGRKRWTGLMHHWDLETRDGVDYLTANFNDDMQFLQFMLCPPNPLLPIPIFQFPRDFWMGPVPTCWGIAATMELNLLRLEGHPYTLPDDPFDVSQYFDIINRGAWQVHVKAPSFFQDSSLWTFMGARMNTLDSVFAAALDDGQIHMGYRRIFTDEGEKVTGLLDNNVANGALVFEPRDRSGFGADSGTFFGGNALTGLARSAVQWGAGFVEDSLSMVADDQTLWADEYWQNSFLGTLAGSPPYTLRDSHYNDLQTKLSHAPATAVSVIVGGDNPTADAIANLIISATGNLIGYFLLGGFDSLGDIAADIIMPFLVGTILAWDEWKNTSRATKLGWVHLHEIYQSGAEMNAWSLAALAVWRGGFKATEAETSHTCVIDPNSTWFIPGLHGETGDRLATTDGAYRRSTGSNILFVNQIEEQTLEGGGDGEFSFTMKVGQNRKGMSRGERTSAMFKSAFDRLHDIGVHIVQ
ncbi:MAG: hypothetical protein ACSLE6_09945 [Mycobacterium sp.]